MRTSYQHQSLRMFAVSKCAPESLCSMFMQHMTVHLIQFSFETFAIALSHTISFYHLKCKCKSKCSIAIVVCSLIVAQSQFINGNHCILVILLCNEQYPLHIIFIVIIVIVIIVIQHYIASTIHQYIHKQKKTHFFDRISSFDYEL